MQTNPHEVPSQVAVLLAGGTHAVHDVVPHDAVLVFATQTPEQRWKPVLQENPHEVPSQVAVLLAGGTHAVHEVVPHDAVLVLSTQTPAQLW